MVQNLNISYILFFGFVSEWIARSIWQHFLRNLHSTGKTATCHSSRPKRIAHEEKRKPRRSLHVARDLAAKETWCTEWQVFSTLLCGEWSWSGVVTDASTMEWRSMSLKLVFGCSEPKNGTNVQSNLLLWKIDNKQNDFKKSALKLSF